jgi:hypothetical protein
MPELGMMDLCFMNVDLDLRIGLEAGGSSKWGGCGDILITAVFLHPLFFNSGFS